ncbi:hypothetical protein O3P69_000760 [Scylla paramamosain]|uniref:Uncharacterized protein n=1 Tax=Scylla paramamosain TaxID=85552 RepID=A0AAW0UUB9_SCYPA
MMCFITQRLDGYNAATRLAAMTQHKSHKTHYGMGMYCLHRCHINTRRRSSARVAPLCFGEELRSPFTEVAVTMRSVVHAA